MEDSEDAYFPREAKARKAIDRQLVAAGWVVQTLAEWARQIRENPDAPSFRARAKVAAGARLEKAVGGSGDSDLQPGEVVARRSPTCAGSNGDRLGEDVHRSQHLLPTDPPRGREADPVSGRSLESRRTGCLHHQDRDHRGRIEDRDGRVRRLSRPDDAKAALGSGGRTDRIHRHTARPSGGCCG